ncbi:amidohydrolase family protein [Tenggerimyces flavus]|uniref:Amidohydrolase family protein n=1 Tax=Tenggerimyces flavus TaxID=1708749 RepID=A0ABV7YGC3_9ACTN|nr:amidohydrolase family protein [Tenggerimyces flavus]MBM7791314.1 imidazolonepropionase-like amidohydrolase [Tenggerimyces flavus]
MYAIRAGRAFDGERLHTDGATVFVEGARIVGVEAPGFAVPDGYVVVDALNGTVLPGLFDTHVHLCGDGGLSALERLPDFTDEHLEDVITTSLAQQLACGVTTVRDLGDRRYAVLDRRDRANGQAEPTILAAGPPVTTRRGHCWNMGGEVSGPDEIRAAIRERAQRGVDLVKVMASGGAMTPGTDILACQFTLDELRLVVDEAHAAGLQVTAHAHGLPSVEQAVAARVDGIEHCTCLVETGIDVPNRLLERLAEQRIAVCPTLGKADGTEPPMPVRELLERNGITWELRQRLMARMHEAGVRLIAGSDTGISPGKPHGLVAHAIGDYVAGGIPTEAALASATSVAAEACGLGAYKGRLRAGFDADVLIVDGDPFADIAALTRVSTVFANGHRLDPPQL